MSAEQSVENMLTYWVPKLSQRNQAGCGDLHPSVLISGRGKSAEQSVQIDSHERIHPSVFLPVGDSNMSRMEGVLRDALFAIANGYNVSVTWEQKQ